MKFKLAFGMAALAAAFVMAMPAARADALSDIKAAGKIRVATAMGVPLFAYVDAQLQPAGSDVETAKMIADSLGVKLELVQITNAARVPTIQAHKADILVANLAITPERKKAVDFTIPYATLDIIVAGPKDAAIKDYKDLAGKRIGVTRATVNDMMVSENAKDAEIVRFEDDATLITAVASGQVDLVSTQTAVLAAMNEKKGGDPLDVKFVQKSLDLGIALPQNEPKLKEWLNNWITEKFKSGELPAMFKKFHKRDLPADLLSRKD
ncbi:transporter substrate-binding domain-containing protein [Mesorhizobium sp. 8]|jgi:polar amino acid transport system substrate-binding protein|uniref:transporter substrate-binding domain-containing protein n=1 Tax=Mesorhizobium sp. 8 TaxID=2584466 RepID=UPI00111E517E|nr:transporter substrate-binding domain-containing protein [Mesorhizobium sp. 8]QDC02411.1 transporter substrate-binding domain-containing protein [Mesorhizobium sp. 8]